MIKKIFESIPHIAKVFADFGTAAIGVAAIWGLLKANDTFEKIGQLSANMNEVKSLSMEIRSTLTLVRSEIKQRAIKSSGVPKVLEDPLLTEAKLQNWLDLVPNTWGKAIRSKSPFFITDFNRRGLVEKIVNQPPKYRLSILEEAALPVETKMAARYILNNDVFTWGRDNFGLSQESGHKYMKLSPYYQDPELNCYCKVIRGEKVECRYEKAEYKVYFPRTTTETEIEVVCEKK